MFFLFIILSNFFLKSNFKIFLNSVNFHVTFLLFLDLLKGLLNILSIQLINVFMNHSTLSCLFIDMFYRFMNFFLLHLFISSLAPHVSALRHRFLSQYFLFPIGEYGLIPGCGFLRLHSTYRHDLKIYASDEGRVQMTAAAFAKASINLFYLLHGELTQFFTRR